MGLSVFRSDRLVFMCPHAGSILIGEFSSKVPFMNTQYRVYQIIFTTNFLGLNGVQHLKMWQLTIRNFIYMLFITKPTQF